jgi:hypothetical protein
MGTDDPLERRCPAILNAEDLITADVVNGSVSSPRCHSLPSQWVPHCQRALSQAIDQSDSSDRFRR